ncbi:hypothetical protein EFY79_00760 [Hanamia caeni]|jgi:hypothetical protein|uniref:Uncharacterized protein n=1 Tax=Hanamia caeni TaxID=2294116 RepID=A0A3M9NQ21_9BACT|nr:hypothetical protein [Hanamia caeni]RNI39866.1 hypothetical protein EFY79_00760 [Hanamia caeni]
MIEQYAEITIGKKAYDIYYLEEIYSDETVFSVRVQNKTRNELFHFDFHFYPKANGWSTPWFENPLFQEIKVQSVISVIGKSKLS